MSTRPPHTVAARRVQENVEGSFILVVDRTRTLLMSSHPEDARIGIGCMRLSTERDRDDTRGIEVLHAALDLGVTFLDTADAYCLDDFEMGHNERLIARALATWSGDRSRIVIATKGGLTRPQARFTCRPKMARPAVRHPLGVRHAPDPRVPFSTTLRALAALKDEGLVARIGLCNVKVGQMDEARRIGEISTVQVELSVWHDENLLNGVVEYCIAHDIQLIASRPLGGRRRLQQVPQERVLRSVAERHGATPAEVALAWLNDLSDHLVSIPGPTRVETVRSIVRAHGIQLRADDREQLNGRFLPGRSLANGAVAGAPQDPPPRGAAQRIGSSDPPAGEVVLIMGLPGGGKSTAARAFVDEGYARLNRDVAGGSLRGLLPDLQRLVGEGSTRIVLDNTYMSRASRARVVQAATQLGLPVRCVWIATSVEDAQVNAVSRIIANHGRLLGPEEMKQAVKRDISAFAPGVQFRHQRELEPPDPAEGFSRIDVVPFERKHDASMINRALIVWCDDTLFGRGPLLQRARDEGWLLLGLAWRPDIEAGTTTHEQVDSEFARLRERLGVSIEVLYCPHAAGPPKCWCRKPLPGLGVVFIQRHRLDPAQCIYVGAGPQDPGFARRLGFRYRDAGEFFASDAVLIP